MEITSENISDYISETQKIPVFLKLYSHWCSHCKELEPTWKQLEAHYNDDERIIIASLSCDSEVSICNKFPHSGTPRLFWIKSGIESNEFYYNTYSFDEFITFIEKRLSDLSISKIPDQAKFREVIQSNEHSSLFFLQDLNSDVDEHIIENILKKYKNTPTKFYRLDYKEFESDSKPVLFYLSPVTNVSDSLHEIINEKSIEAFVDLHSFPPVYNATTFFFREHIRKSSPFMFYYENGTPFSTSLINLSKSFPKELKTGIVNCSEAPRMCRTFGIQFNDGNQLSIIYPLKNIYYHYEGEYNANDVMSWVESVMKGKETPLGPGAGLSGFVYNLKIQSKKPKFWYRLIRNSIIGIAVVSVFIFIIVKMIKLGSIPETEDISSSIKVKNE